VLHDEERQYYFKHSLAVKNIILKTVELYYPFNIIHESLIWLQKLSANYVFRNSYLVLPAFPCMLLLVPELFYVVIDFFALKNLL
jgi:hypothetical protein